MGLAEGVADCALHVNIRQLANHETRLRLTFVSVSAFGGNWVLLPDVGLIGVAGGLDGAGEAAEEPGVPTS